MFGNKLFEGLAHSAEFVGIIGVVPFLHDFAYQLAPFVGTLDFCVALTFLLNPYVTKNPVIQKILFVWVAVWPFVPASLRYFGGVGDFEILEVLSITVATALSFFLWVRFSPLAKAK